MNYAGDKVAIGAPYNDGGGTDAGLVRVYAWSANSWTQFGANIYGTSANDNLGGANSLNSAGDRVAVSSSNANMQRGYARLFSLSNNASTQLGTDLTGTQQRESFGLSISLDSTGNRLGISALGNQGDPGFPPFMPPIPAVPGYISIYSFITGPEINVKGNAVSIADGDVTPSTTDSTDFGSAVTCNGTIVRRFTIENTGAATLNISGAALSGTNMGDFTITASPSGTVSAAGSTTVEVTFDPSANGTRSATLTISSDDADEGTYDFAIQGTGIADNVAPSITCPGNRTVNNDNAVLTWNSATGNINAPVSDNCPGSITKRYSSTGATVIASTSGNANNKNFNLGTSTVTYVATDNANNSTSCSFTVTVNLNIGCPAPVTKSTSPGVCTWYSNGAVDLTTGSNTPGAYVTYSSVGATTINGYGNARLRTFNKGLSTITYVVADNAGHSSSCSFALTVVDLQGPILVCPANITVNNTPGLCTGTVVNLGIATATDNCGPASTPGAEIPRTFNAGTTNLTWTSYDNNHNTGTCAQTVTVRETEAPVARCRNAKVVLNSAGSYTMSDASILNNESTDNCGIASYTATPSVFSCQNISINNTVILTVTDLAGNTATCNSTVTVVDVTAPHANCVSRNYNLGLDGKKRLSVANLASLSINSFDVCSPISISATPNFFNCDNLGANPVQLLLTDASGNTSTCNLTLTIIDNSNVCPGIKKGYIQVDNNGSSTLITFPNPFSDFTKIRFTTEEDQTATVKVFSVTGIEIQTIFNGWVDADTEYTIEFRGDELSNGMYFVKLFLSSGEVKMEKVVLQK